MTTGRVGRRVWWVLGVVLLGLGAGAAALWSRGGPRLQEVPEGPSGAVIAMFNAYRSRDCAAFMAATTERHQNDPYIVAGDCDQFAQHLDTVLAMGEVTVEITSIVPLGDRQASVAALETYEPAGSPRYRRVVAYRVLLIDDVWKVDHLDLTVLPDHRPQD